MDSRKDGIRNDPDKLLREVQNSSARQVARDYGVSGRTVRRWLDDYGFVFDGENWIDPDYEYGNSFEDDDKLTEDDLDVNLESLTWEELRDDPQLLLESSQIYSAYQLAKMFGKGEKTIRRWLKKYGFDYDGTNWFNPEDNDALSAIKEGQESRKPDVDDLGDYYLITSGSRSFKISKEKYKNIRRDYCDEIGNDYLNISNICIEHNISRKDFELLKSAFNFVHRDVRYIDEEVEKMSVDEMVDLTLEEKKNLYVKKLQQKEIKNLRKEVSKYRKKDYFLDGIRDRVSEDLERFSKDYAPPKLNISGSLSTKEKRMLEAAIVDLHLAKMAWGVETGEDYSLQIAEDYFLDLIEKIIERVSHFDIEKVVLPFGNDFYHYDDSEGRTTKGTSMDVDSRWQKMFSRGVRLFIKAIDMFRQITPVVEVFRVPGNHDWTVSFYAIEYLNAWYKGAEDIFINTDPQSRKYVQYGENLIGFTHGSEISKSRLKGLMQAEVPKKWAESGYREWHLGHEHSEDVSEDMGVIIRKLPSITGKDSWHYEKGYTPYRRNQVFLWGKNAGDMDISVINMN